MRTIQIILIISLFFGCSNSKDENIHNEIVEKVSSDLFRYRLDSLKKYSSEEFILEKEGRVYNYNDGFYTIEEGLSNYKKMETQFDSIQYVDDGVGGSIKVMYTLSNWIMECFGNQKLLRIDTYYLLDKEIVKIEQSVLNREIVDSVSISNQRNFFSWAQSKGLDDLYLDDGTLDQDNFFSYLRKYCDQKNEESAFID
ncbi:hypothetical protein SAMN05421640_0883 [Ekhidna lutea]|uniref:BRCT domain-containing protein n=1 Tax=Ekhidna lutea TaxID=447679 RepID=A0A239GJX2_EKHLU|nr:hypothetical protein [Ekhidna lutea]SNS69467.1 hypothetical protein SAMN05421640_0883 [Ekhidna lutea]